MYNSGAKRLKQTKVNILDEDLYSVHNLRGREHVIGITFTTAGRKRIYVL
jgi:hypothetical protein